MGQNALDQSDRRIFKSTKSVEHDKKSLLFCMLIQFIEIKSWMKSIGVGVVINGCAYSGRRTQKLWLYLTKKLMEWTDFCVLIWIQESLKLF